LAVDNLAGEPMGFTSAADDYADFEINFQFEQEDVSEDDNDYTMCTPSHESGHTIYVPNHPADGWSGHYCRMEDWNGFPHFAKDSTHHWYYYELPGALFCW